MANATSHASLPYPVKNARYTIPVPYLDADGDPTDPTTPDTEVSKDGGAFADCAEEVTTITGSNGLGYLTLTGAETNCSLLSVVAKVASGPKATILIDKPRVLPIILSGTASAGGSTSITLAAGAYDLTGCIVRTTGGTGGGGTGGANNQARVITAYNTSTLVATVEPAWETNPDNTTTYDILLTELACNTPVTRGLRPATDGRTLVVDAAGLADANMVKAGPTGSGTAQTARDLGASVLLSNGTGTGQISLSSGAVLLQATQTGVTIPTVTTLTNAPSDSSGTTTLLSRLSSSRAGYLDNLNVGGAVASQADVQAVNQSASKHLLITTVGQYERPESGNTTYTVEVRTFAALTGAAVNADSTPTVSPVGATSGSLSANLGAGSNPATGVYRYTYTVASNATQEQIRFDVSATISTSTFTLSCYTQVVDLVSATWTSADATKLTAIYDKLPTNAIADETLVLEAISNVQTDTTAIKAKTNSLTFTVAGMVDSNVIDWKGATAPAMTGDAFARLGAPAGVSVSADIAAAKADTAAILDDTGTAGVVVATGSKTGYALSATGLNLVIPADPGTTKPTFAGNSTIVQWIAYFGAWSVNPAESDDDSVTLKNTAGNANLASHTTADDGTTFTIGAAS